MEMDNLKLIKDTITEKMFFLFLTLPLILLFLSIHTTISNILENIIL